MEIWFGYITLGGAYYLFALWWTIQIFCRHFKSVRKTGPPYRSAATFPCCCTCFKCCCRYCFLDFEPLLKFSLSISVFIVIIIQWVKAGHTDYVDDARFLAIYFFFALSGVIDIMVRHKWPLPHGIEYAILSIAFIMEAMFFTSYPGNKELSEVLHRLLYYAIIGTIVCLLLEVRFRRSPLIALGRTIFVMIQGTWIWQITISMDHAETLPESWNIDDKYILSLATLLYAAHIAMAIIIVLVIGALIGCCFCCKGKGKVNGKGSKDEANVQLIKRDANGHTIVNLNEESDSDIEFQRPIQKVYKDNE